MKSGVIYSIDDIRVEDRSNPVLHDNETLIRVKACGICTGELTPWYITKKTKDNPGGYIPGHEFVGVIEKFGKNQPDQVIEGERIFVHHHAPCFEPDCHFCQRHKYVQCPTWKKLTTSNGGMAEFVAVKNYAIDNDSRKLYSMSFEQGTFIEPLACSVKAVGKANVRKGDTVLIIGAGVMGLLNALLCKLEGANIILSEIDNERIKFIKSINSDINADAIVNPLEQDLVEVTKSLSDGRGADAVIVGPSLMQAIQQGIDCAAPGANIVPFMSLPADENLVTNHFNLYFNEINLIPSYSCGPAEVAEAREFIDFGKIKVDKLITSIKPIDDFPEAFKTAAKGGANIKTIITFD